MRILLVIVLCVHVDSGADLLDVGQATRCAGALTSLSKDGEQNCREDGDNGDYYEQFNQRKTISGACGHLRPPWEKMNCKCKSNARPASIALRALEETG